MANRLLACHMRNQFDLKRKLMGCVPSQCRGTITAIGDGKLRLAPFHTGRTSVQHGGGVDPSDFSTSGDPKLENAFDDDVFTTATTRATRSIVYPWRPRHGLSACREALGPLELCCYEQCNRYQTYLQVGLLSVGAHATFPMFLGCNPNPLVTSTTCHQKAFPTS